MWSTENGLTIHDKNENGNDFKIGRTIQFKTIKFWKKITMKKYSKLGISRK